MIIESDRLCLRQWRKDDYDTFFSLNSDVQAMKFFPNTLSREESDDLADKCAKLISERGFGFFAVERKDTQEFIGFIGLHTPDYLPFGPCTEIGWRLHPRFWKRGYATEGAAAVLNYAFNELKCMEVLSFASKQNTPSIAVMRRIGMEYVEGGDFYHPRIQPGHPLSRHVLYRLGSPHS